MLIRHPFILQSPISLGCVFKSVSFSGQRDKREIKKTLLSKSSDSDLSRLKENHLVDSENTDTPLISFFVVVLLLLLFLAPWTVPRPQSPPTISHQVGVCSILAHTMTVHREAYWNTGTPVFFDINLLVLPLPKRTDRRWVGAFPY